MSDIIIPFGFSLLGSTRIYVPLTYGSANSPVGVITEGWAQYIAPYNLTITEVVIRSLTLNHGSTIVGTHIDENTTPIDTDTQTLNTDSGNVVFTLGTSVLKGERISISLDPTTTGGELSGYVRLTIL